MRGIITIGAVLMLGVPSARAQGVDGAIRLDGFAATVNTTVITIGDVRAAMEPALHRLRLQHDSAELETRADALFSETLERMIERELLAEEFARREFPFPEHWVEAEISRMVTERFQGRYSAFLDAMASERLTLDRYRARLRNEMKATALYQEEVSRRVVIAPADLRAEYEAHRSSYVLSARVRVRAIEFRGGEPEERRARAVAAQARLEAGESFSDVARDVSDDRRAAEGGDWGWRNVDDLHPDIEAALSALSIAESSETISITDRLFLLRVEEREPGRVQSLAEVWPDVEARVRRREEQRLRQRMLDRLQRHHAVRILVSSGEG